ncbi:hypothetical protein, partial [Mycobacterium tuberculosis]|uniref:hypothetical protein n=1 Tax=Mycobacterium tuberculosis TaxID=1773 RepID=UPI001BDE7998
MRFTVAARLQVRRRERGSRPPGYGNPFIPFLPNSPPARTAASAAVTALGTGAVSSGAAVTAVADQP